MVGTRASRSIGFLAVGAVVAAACAGEPTTAARVPASTLPPDTGSLGLRAVDGAPLLVLVDDAAVVDTAARRRLALQRAQSTSAVVRVARLVDGADTLLAVGRAVAFDVSPTRRLVFVGARRERAASGGVFWMGQLQGGRAGQADLVLSPGSVNASLRVLPPDGVVYSVQPLGDGFHAVTYVDPSRFLPD
jgi:hypothetical protein